MEELKEATLRQLGFPAVAHAEETVEVVATVLGPREELDEPMRESLARVLAHRVRRKLGEQTPAGVASAKVDYNDQADCEDLKGEQVSAFMAGERCYRVVLRVATA